MACDTYELVELNGRQRKLLAKGSWGDIMNKMEGAGRGLFDNSNGNHKKNMKRLYDMSGVVFTSVLFYYIYHLLIKMLGG